MTYWQWASFEDELCGPPGSYISFQRMVSSEVKVS
jgi:hypothetical protein